MVPHAELSMTEVYTQVSMGKLKEQHTAMPPGKLPQAGQSLVIEGRQPA
jgi:hypothetical protein